MCNSKIINFYGLEYEVFDNGKIIGCASKKEIAQRHDKDGYLTFTCGVMNKRTCMKVHKAVALSFLTKPVDFDPYLYDIDHIDNNRTNNHVSNLRYMTHIENVKKAHACGNHIGTKVGEINGRAVYSEKEVLKIRELYDSGAKVMDIIKEFHPNWDYKKRKNHWNTFMHICKRNTWKHI